MNLKELFLNENDELAEKIGKEIVRQLELKKLQKEPGWKEDRWEMDGSSFSLKGLARRMARIFIENAQ